MPIRPLLVTAWLLLFPAIALADVVPPPDATTVDAGEAGASGGCAAAPGRSTGAGWLLVTSLMALGLAARRR